MIKPDKIIYENQDVIHDEIVDFVRSKLTEDVKEAHLFGSAVNKQFGRYVEKYQSHQGSDIDVLIIMPNDKIPKGWKYLNTEKDWWRLYFLGSIAINGTIHKLEAIVVKEGKEDYSLNRIKELSWKVERIVL